VKDLLVTTHTPTLGSGRDLRTYGIARALAAHEGLTLLYVRFGAREPDAAFKAIPGVELVEVVPSRGLRRMLAYGTARLAGSPGGFARGVSPELQAEAARLAAQPGRGRVIADGPTAAVALAALAGRRPVVYNAHNLESAFRHDVDDRGLGTRRALRRFERRLLERASESWMVSEAELGAARELCPNARLRYVPNVVDVASIEPVSSLAPQERAIFIANFRYAPNLTALRFLLEQIFPRVWTQLADARLTLVGGGLGQLPAADRRVEVLGFVDDLGPVYADARCAVIPLLHGGGTPLKFIEALAYGLPVVATPRAAAGLAVRDGEHCLLAEGTEEFAAAVVRVLRGGAAELGSRGRQLAAERYSIEALSELLAA
jgi:glycosyltransferase involved in cell wall biosynthesis